MKKLLFIFNPIAGKKLMRSKLLYTIDLFTKYGWIVTTYPTQKRNSIRKIAIEIGKSFDLIVCAGGDGTFNETVKAISTIKNAPPLAYIPCGSTNDFGYTLGIPMSIEKAAKIAMTGTVFACDLGTFNRKLFTYIAAFGIFTEVPYQTSQQMKNVFGHFAYILEAVKNFSKLKSYQMKIVADGKKYCGDYLLGTITNSNSIGGYKNLSKLSTVLNDGLFEVILIKKPRNPLEYNNLIASILMQNLDCPYLEVFKARKISFYSASTKTPWTLDGERGGSHQLVKIKNHKKAIKYIISNPKKINFS